MEEPEAPEKIVISPGVVSSDIPDNIYYDLEKYLYNGYLTCNATIQGAKFIFKTLNLREMQYLRLLYPNPDGDLATKNSFRASFIAHSILVINGMNALLDRSHNIVKLTKLASRYTSHAQELIVKNLTFINEKAARLYPLVEVYAHEHQSRFHWLQLKDIPLNSRTMTGFPGSEELSLNTCQLTWLAINRMLDKKEVIESNWNHAKFVGSCFAGKGIRSIDEQDTHRKEREKQEIREKKVQIVKKYLDEEQSEESVKETIKLPDGRMAEVVSRHRPESVEELADVLSRSLNHEKDAHDRAVERYFENAKQHAQKIQEQSLELERVITPISETSGSMAVSPGEAQNRIQKMRETILRNKEKMGVKPDPE